MEGKERRGKKREREREVKRERERSCLFQREMKKGRDSGCKEDLPASADGEGVGVVCLLELIITDVLVSSANKWSQPVTDTLQCLVEQLPPHVL